MTSAALSIRHSRAAAAPGEGLVTRHARWLLVAGALGVSLLFGLIAGVSPKYAIVGVGAIGFGVIVVIDLVAAFGVFAALTFLETLSSGGAASVDKLAGLVILFAWLVRLATESRRPHRLVLIENRTLFVWLTLYLALNLISAAWSTSSGAAISQAYRYTLDALLIPIVYTIVDTRADLLKIIVGYLFGAAFSVIYGFAHPEVGLADQAGRLTGSIGEANQSATILVAAIALCAGVWILSRRSSRLRIFVIAVGVLSVIGLVGTLSRSGLLAFGVVLLLAAIVGGPARRPAVWVCLIIVIAAPTYFVFFAGQRAHRVDSAQSSGRDDIWLVALREWDAHPVLGVGAGNFEVVSHDYLQQPGLIVSANDFVYDPKVVHNIYLEQLVTLGPAGLILLLGAFAVLVRTGVRAYRMSEWQGDLELEMLARFWLLALVAFLTADFFASELVDKQLWIVIALGPALHKLAHLERPAQAPATAPSLPARTLVEVP